jgi:DNA-binding XRE family transcriptional regulator
LLGWPQDELARVSEVAKKTIADFEREARTPYPRTLRDIRLAFEDAGIAFIAADRAGGPGVRLRKPKR